MPALQSADDPQSRLNAEIRSLHPARAAAVAGVSLIILGVIALVVPFIASVAMTYLVAVLVLLSAVALLALAVGGDITTGQRVLGVIAAVVLFIGGIGMIAAPGLGLLSLTAAVAIYFFMSGFSRVFAAFLMPRGTGRGAVGLSGALSVVLGVLLLKGWPSNAPWAIGVLVGIDLLSYGGSLVASAWTMRSIRRDFEAARA